MKRTAGILRIALAFALGLAVSAVSQPASAQQTKFAIRGFQVEGNTILTEAEIDRVLQPFVGPERNARDIQLAVRALEALYASQGYGAVLVQVPEQEITGGTIRLSVREARLGKVTIAYSGPPGAFDESNIRASLPHLEEGTVPNTIALASDVQLANQNPAKRVKITLKQAAAPDRLDAEIGVAAADPLKVFALLDNTGNEQTGRYRVGIGVQHANVLGTDQIATAMLQTSPDKPDKVRIYTLSYRVPLYGVGGSVDLVAGTSSVDAGSTQTVAGPLEVSGKGRLFSVRYNQPLTRHGEYAHQLVYGWDRREYDNSCSLGIFGAAGCGAGGASVTVRPASISYTGRVARPGLSWDVMLAAARNLPGGAHGGEADLNAARPSALGQGGAPADYLVFRMGASLRDRVGSGALLLASLGAQQTPDPLVPAEQYGLTGAGAVRGYDEREVARDNGYLWKLELESPDVGPRAGLKSDLRLAAFFDAGLGYNNTLPGESSQHVKVAGAGLGARWVLGRQVGVRLDVARALRDGVTTRQGNTHAHLSIEITF